jgi:hypothetical protein
VPNSAALKTVIVLNVAWCLQGPSQTKKVHAKHLIPLSDRRTGISSPAANATLRFRNVDGAIVVDDSAHLNVSEGRAFLHSDALANDIIRRDSKGLLLYVLIEQVQDIVRIAAHYSTEASLMSLAQSRPELRLSTFDLPPMTVTEIEPEYGAQFAGDNGLYGALIKNVENEDTSLFSAHTEKFLQAPHIVVPLLSHLASLSADENLKFPVQLKRLADQFRALLEMESAPIKVRKIARDHLGTWAEAEGERYAFIDGGVAKIAGLPGTEPTALRVGAYSVRAGDTSLETRESWELHPYVVGDIIDKNTGVHLDDDDQIDLRRLGEAARYTLEPLTALQFAQRNPDVAAVFLHGPLINQFVMYDEGEPHFIPLLKEAFLVERGITQEKITSVVADIPRGIDGSLLWRQFMAVYGYLTAQLIQSAIPFVGVVERSAGTWLAQAVLDGAVQARLVNQGYRKKVMTLLKRYSISDDFLFGCVLAEGEYLTPALIPKNDSRRARDHWKRAVDQYRRPFATVLKTSEQSFPFRIEMSAAGEAQQAKLLRLLFHTARLLPRYAFPVGLDIADKFAKVPDWLSRNISARLAAAVLNRAMAEGDARLVAQIRQVLSHTPRDFFYRPQA